MIGPSLLEFNHCGKIPNSQTLIIGHSVSALCDLMPRVLCFTALVNWARFLRRRGEVGAYGDGMGDQFLRGGIAVWTLAVSAEVVAVTGGKGLGVVMSRHSNASFFHCEVMSTAVRSEARPTSCLLSRLAKVCVFPAKSGLWNVQHPVFQQNDAIRRRISPYYMISLIYLFTNKIINLTNRI
ncbi:hypothetical protein [Rhizobium hidalgonense]|uniref:hypothetical protein n=1 Tax=Rhizobium hidalgonense TaxID=1538159 RepID=UPI0028774220|nr:hypothetical protein [Rhizobium hidalgonense]